jgi:hypothetical protein
MASTKIYFQIVISKKPIPTPKDTEGIQHLVNAEAHPKQTDKGWKLIESFPSKDGILKESGEGRTISIAVSNFLKNVFTHQGYKPFRRRKSYKKIS